MANDPNEELVDGILRKFSQLSGGRGTFESHWEEVALRCQPHASGTFTHGSMTTPGAKKTHEQIDSTAQLAGSRFMSIMDSLLTPRNTTWHSLGASHPSLNRDRAVREWFEEVTRILFQYRYAPSANFQGQNQQVFQALGFYGNGPLFVDQYMGRRGEQGIRYKALHIGEAYLTENHQGTIDGALRYFKTTLRQGVQKWPDTFPDTLKEKAKTAPETETAIIHCIQPREDYDPERIDNAGKLYASHYIAVEAKALLQEGGYNSFPVPTARYEQAPGEVYARSPAMMMLPAIKTLNEQKKAVLEQAHRTVRPILLTHDDGIKPSLRPGAIVVGGMSHDGKRRVDTLPVGRIDVGKEMMDDERAVINDAFLITLFQILTETPTMTATEVIERTREKGILLAPTTGRLQSEYLGALIERELDILSELRLLPPMPPALIEAKGEYTVTYTSPLSRAMRAEEGAGTLRTIESILAIATATQDPDPMDWFDMDEIVPELASINGMPVKFLNDLKRVMEKRGARAEMMQRQEDVTAAPGAAALISANAKAKKAA